MCEWIRSCNVFRAWQSLLQILSHLLPMARFLMVTYNKVLFWLIRNVFAVFKTIYKVNTADVITLILQPRGLPAVLTADKFKEAYRAGKAKLK